MNTHLILGPIDAAAALRFYRFAGKHPSIAMGGGSAGILLSSPGGDVGLMIGMFDTIVQYDFEMIAMGLAQSAAAVLFQAGHRRYMYPNSMLLFHEPPVSPEGKYDDTEWYLFTKLVAMVAQRTGAPIPEAHDYFDGRFITAQRALELNLCDEILNDGERHDGLAGNSLAYIDQSYCVSQATVSDDGPGAGGGAV